MLDEVSPASAEKPSVDKQPSRLARGAVLAFVQDAESEAILRDGLSEALPEGIEVRRGGVTAAISTLQKSPTPRTLIIDVSGHEQALTALGDLSQVVEPEVRVLVIGDREDLNFYRLVTRGLGVLEYLYKPLVKDMVARHFGPLVGGQGPAPEAAFGGRMVTITGVRGGVGASTIASALAWQFGAHLRRHTLLLDADVQRGACATLLKAKTNSGLRNALEAPQRLDELFIERAAQPASDRLHVLGAEDKPGEEARYVQGAGEKLVEVIRRRFNLIVADVPFSGHPFQRDLLDLTQQRVLVMTPTLLGVRDALRLLSLPAGPQQARRALIVLNRHNLPGGLSRTQIEEALQLKADVLIPDLPRQAGLSASLGDPTIISKGGFRQGILALAREIAFVRVVGGAESPKSARRGLFGLRRRAA
ncbi:MAG TPA: cellulose synthase operon protein YhjQ/BcsQ [Acidisphaera sp.]|nr:cellulose synthase operon protein YhjQ/BcsQ [Acidisphaera sp.]